MTLRNILSILTFGAFVDRHKDEEPITHNTEADIQEQFNHSKTLRTAIRVKAEDLQSQCQRKQHAT